MSTTPIGAEVDDLLAVIRDEFEGLIQEAQDEYLIDWLTEAIRAAVSVCLHHPGATANSVLEAIRYELTNTAVDDEDDPS